MMKSSEKTPDAQATEALAHSLFPEGEVKVSGKGFEVNGLKAGTQPQNCEVILRGQRPNAQERREHFLVRTDNAIAFFRICAAMPGCGYEEFVVCLDSAPIGTEEARSVEEWARDSIPVLSRQF